ncbi:retrovirus-related pol polyprotein from transposon TNT 1-94 [Tanacetum coccineum]
MRILSVVRIKAYSRYGYDYLSKIVLRRADFQEHTIAEKDFKNLYPSDFEDLNLLLLQGHLDHLPGLDKWMLSTAVKLWTAGYEFKYDYTIIESPRAVEFPRSSGSTWLTESKEFIAAIKKATEDEKDIPNQESFVGNEFVDIDYRLLRERMISVISVKRSYHVILPAESQMNVIDPSVTITDSSATEYDLADESSVCSTSSSSTRRKLAGAEPVSEPKTFKSILNSNSILKVGSLKAPAGKVKNVKTEDDIPLSECPYWYLKDGSQAYDMVSKATCQICGTIQELRWSINHEKYTLVIVDEYSRSDNGTEFRNSILVNFCDENGISQNFSFSYTPKQNGVAKRKNRSLIEAARTMLSGSVFSNNIGLKLVFNTRRQQIEETYHITFNERTKAIKFLKPSLDDINIVESKKNPHDEYVHPYEPSQRYQVDSNVVQYIEPYEKPEPIVIEVDASLDQNDQAYQNDQMDQNDVNDQNDHPVQANGILTDD